MIKERKTKAYIFYGIIVLLLLVIGIFFGTGIIERKLERKLEKYVYNKTGISVSIGNIHTSLFKSTIILSALNIKKGGVYNVSIGRLKLVFEPPSILKEKPRIKFLDLQDVHAFAVLNVGNNSFAAKRRNSNFEESIKNLPFTVDHIIVSNANLSFSIPSYKALINIKNTSMNIYTDIHNENGSGVIDLKDIYLSNNRGALTIAEASFDGRVDSAGMMINRLRIKDNSGNIVLSGFLNNYVNPYLSMHVKASFHDMSQLNTARRIFPISFPDIQGSINIDSRIRGSVFNPDAYGYVVFENLKIGNIQGGTGKINYTLREHKLRIKNADIDIAGGMVKFDGSINMSDNRIPSKFVLSLNNVSFGKLLKSLGVPTPYVDASLTGKVNVKGSFNPIYFSGTTRTEFKRFSVYDDYFLASKKMKILTVRPALVDSRFIINDRYAYLYQTSTKTDHSIVYTNTALYFTGAMFLEFNSSNVDMTDVSPIASIPYTGIGAVHGYIAGPFTDIVIYGLTDFSHYGMEGIHMGHTKGGIRFNKNVLALEAIRINRGNTKAYVNGGISFTKGVSLHLVAIIKHLSMADIAYNIDKKLTAGGYATGTIMIDGPVKKMNGYTDLYFSQPSVQWQSFDKGVVKISMNNGIVKFDRCIFNKGRGEINVRGTLSERNEVNLDFDSNKFFIKEIDLVNKSQLPVKALLSFTGNVYGRLTKPKADLSVKVLDSYYRDKLLSGSRIELNLKNDELFIRARLFGDSLYGDASLRIGNGYEFELASKFNKFSMSPFIKLFSKNDIVNGITGKAWFVGKLKDVPDSLVGYVYLTDLTLGNHFAVLKNGGPVFVDVANNDLYFRNFLIKGKNSFFKLKGFVNFNGNIDTLVDADINLNYLPLFTNMVAGSSGKFKLDARIEGKAGHTMINGNSELNGAITLSQYPVAISSLRTSVFIRNNSVTINELTGIINGGSMSGSGKIITKGILPEVFDLSLMIKGMNYVYNDTIPVHFNASLGLKGNYKQPVLQGNVDIINASYTDYINWEDELLKFQHRKYEVKSIENKKHNPLHLDVSIYANDSIVVDNNLVNSVLSMDLKVIGDIDDPVILGNITSNSGQILYRSSTFNIDNILVTYTREHPGNPFVEVRASMENQYMVNNEYTDYMIYLNVSGELGKLNIILTSNPPNLDETDIISLLTYGITTFDLAKSGVSSVAAYELGAAVGSKLAKDMFSEFMGSTNLNNVKKYFWIDNLQIEPYYPRGLSSTSLKVTVSKRITNNFVVNYSYDLNGYNFQRFQSEYRLSKRLYLTGDWDNEMSVIQQSNTTNNVGNIGGDIKYKLQF